MTYFIYCLSGSSIDHSQVPQSIIHTEEFVGQCTKIRVRVRVSYGKNCTDSRFFLSSEVVGGSGQGAVDKKISKQQQ
jgi:hypothetical protein